MAHIKRPDLSINKERSDDNYGLFFVPADPNDEDWQSGGWLPHVEYDNNNTVVKEFEYKVILRGKIVIENLDINCNMGNQDIGASVESDKVEHSAMIGCSGMKYSSDKPEYVNKFIFIAFESFELNKLNTYNGGYADDIWIGRGYFRPNIQNVIINNITSHQRVNKKRATISFSGLCKNASITNADVFRIEIEETTKKSWRELPENVNDPANYSLLKLRNIKCDILDLAAKGKAIYLDGKNVTTRQQGYFYQVGGKLSNSNIVVHNGQNRRMIRLNHMLFKNVTWHIGTNDDGKIMGILPIAEKGQSCEIAFENNKFMLINQGGIPTRGAMIDTIKESLTIEGSTLFLTFKKCKFDEKVMQVEAENLYAIKMMPIGEYHFIKNEFLTLRDKLKINKDAIITTEGNKILVKI